MNQVSLFQTAIYGAILFNLLSIGCLLYVGTHSQRNSKQEPSQSRGAPVHEEPNSFAPAPREISPVAPAPSRDETPNPMPPAPSDVPNQLPNPPAQSATDSASNRGVCFNLPKMASEGEDADPILRQLHDGTWLLGVFDGMGGRGARVYSHTATGASHTGGWFGSRRVRDAVEQYFTSGGKDGVPDLQPLAALLKQDLQSFLSRELQAPDTKLRGALLSELPTTLSCALVRKNGKTLETTVLNAGDSRIYALHPRFGLRLLSKDDVRIECDELDSLINDPPLAQFVSASDLFALKESRHTLPEDAVVLAVTDGCFGYLDSPMHFEYLLLDQMVRAGTWEEWSAGIRQRFSQIASDDCSLAAIAPAHAEFSSMALAFQPRYAHVQSGYIAPMDAHRVEWSKRKEVLARVTSEAEISRGAFETIRRDLWKNYQRERQAAL